jgi:hypothetical protein
MDGMDKGKASREKKGFIIHSKKTWKMEEQDEPLHQPRPS